MLKPPVTTIAGSSQFGTPKTLSDKTSGNLDSQGSEQMQESRWISLLRSDSYGQLVETPKFRKFATDYIANKWRSLAIKSGYNHSSGMAMPCPQLQRGTICAPNLPQMDRSSQRS